MTGLKAQFSNQDRRYQLLSSIVMFQPFAYRVWETSDMNGQLCFGFYRGIVDRIREICMNPNPQLW